MKVIKERLLAQERRRQAEEREQKEEEEKIAELRKDPYSEEIGQCKKLISYLGLFTDSQEETKAGGEGTTNPEKQDQAYIDSLSNF